MRQLDWLLPWRFKKVLADRDAQIEELQRGLEIAVQKRAEAEKAMERHKSTAHTFANFLRVSHRLDTPLKEGTIRHKLMGIEKHEEVA